MAVSHQILSDFLDEFGLTHLRDRLLSEDIDMTVLPLLEDDDFKELGLTLGERKKMLKALSALNAASSGAGNRVSSRKSTPVQLRRLSVMFCDMVGSTELGEQLDIDEMQMVLQHYYDIAVSTARRHGGYLAASQGDGLVILFGYPRVLDGFAERCVLAARDLQNALSTQPVHIEGQAPFHITTRIGIASGQAAVGLKQEDGSGDQIHLVGPVVNRAARLQTVASEGSSVVDAKTHDLTKTSVLYAEPEIHQLKGLSEPATVYSVVGFSDGADAWEDPSIIVGRDAELNTLADLWAGTRNGHTATVSVYGEAGIGKSALVRNFLATKVQNTTRVLRLDCSPMAAQTPLRPVAKALTGREDAESEQQSLADILRDEAGRVTDQADQFLGLSKAPSDQAAEPEFNRDAFLDLLTRWILNENTSPTVVVLENAQWADDTTRELLRRTAQKARNEGPAVLMLEVTRDDTNALWSDTSGHTLLALAPLDITAADHLLRHLLSGVPVPHSVRANILYNADGNPLMLETLSHAQTRHELPEVADAVTVPHTIYESVSKRLDTIQSGRGVIEALAVIGTPVGQVMLQQVSKTQAEDVAKALVALENAGLIQRQINLGEEAVSIRHKAYRDVIYEQIDGLARRQLHIAAYHALKDLPEVRPEILANHAQAGHDWTNASMHALDAAEAFLKRSALVEAGHFFEMADVSLNRLPASPSVNQERLRAVTGLASVERSRFGIATDRSAVLGQKAAELARDTGDRPAELLALNGLYSHALVRADYPKAEHYAKALLSAAELSQNKTFVMIGTRAIGAVALHRGDQETAAPHLTRSLEQYDRVTHLSLAHAHGYDHAEISAALLSMSLWISGDLKGSRHYSAFSITHSREIDHAHSLAQAISFRVMLGALARHGSELTDIGAEGITVAEKHGIHVMHAAARLFPFATALCLRAEPPNDDEMADLGHRVDEFRKVNPFNYRPLLATILADISLRAGDTAAADAVLADGMETERSTGETWTSSELLRMQAQVAAAKGDIALARQQQQAALSCAHRTHAATIALRISCDMAEAEPSPASLEAVRSALSKITASPQDWDVRRAHAILQRHPAS